MSAQDFKKDYFQSVWGAAGYQEDFKYGIGIDATCAAVLNPFFDKSKTALEIGCGGGSFTKRMVGNFAHVTAIDVIKPPEHFAQFKDFTYYELPEQNTLCSGVADASVDFVFCYNVFCHLSDAMISSYISSAKRVLKAGGDFVFMLSNFDNIKHIFPDKIAEQKPGQLTPALHFYQDLSTLNRVIKWYDWTVVNPNMVPAHRDIVVHLRKK